MRGRKIKPFLFKCSLFTCFAWKSRLKYKHRLGLKHRIEWCSAKAMLTSQIIGTWINASLFLALPSAHSAGTVQQRRQPCAAWHCRSWHTPARPTGRSCLSTAVEPSCPVIDLHLLPAPHRLTVPGHVCEESCCAQCPQSPRWEALLVPASTSRSPHAELKP